MELPSTPVAIVNMQVQADQIMLEQEYPPNLFALARRVHRPIGPGDTVAIEGVDEVNHPFNIIIGRILGVEVEINSMHGIHVPFHPSIDPSPLPPNTPLALLQIFITKTQSKALQPSLIWPSYDANTMLSTNGVSECSPANLLVWISPHQIKQIISVLHLDDVINQVFGPVCNRDLTYFTTANVIFEYPGGSDLHDRFAIECHDYFAFGRSTRDNKPWNITETERQTESKYRINRMGNQLLTTMRNIGGIDRVSEFMSRGQWCHILSELTDSCPSLIPKEGSDAITKETKQVIIRGNLSLESKRLATRQVSITARTSTQLATLRSYFSSTFGVGIQKRAPSLKAADRGDGISNLQKGDIIHMVDVDLSILEDTSMYEDLISSNAVNTETSCKPQRNFIRLKYDTRMRQFSLTFRALALNANNSGADAVCAFMVRNEIAWYNDGLTGFRVSTCWKIKSSQIVRYCTSSYVGYRFKIVR